MKNIIKEYVWSCNTQTYSVNLLSITILRRVYECSAKDFIKPIKQNDIQAWHLYIIKFQKKYYQNTLPGQCYIRRGVQTVRNI